MTESRVLRRLREGDFVTVAAINRVAESWMAETVGRIGYDAIWFDMEHRAFGFDRIEPMALACRATGIDLMVRVLKTGYTSAMRALEFGANGILVPHCRDEAEARQWVEWVKFPPLGRRGFDGAGADADYALADPQVYLQHANARTFLAVQVEDREAVECVERIAAVPGLDLLFVGPGDLSLSYGVPFDFTNPVFEAAVDRVAAAAARAGIWWAIPTGSPEDAQKALDRGARMITAGNDHGFLVNGFQDTFAAFRRIGIRDAGAA